MKSVPKARDSQTQLISKQNPLEKSKIVFSFRLVDKNQYFNLDATCENWSKDLFDTLQVVSDLTENDIYSSRFSGKNSTLRIHAHNKNVKPPCQVPNSVALDEMYQIRISKSKGGIHGIFIDNVFYVIWFDPQHNLYPDEHYGGLTVIHPPTSCCDYGKTEITELTRQKIDLESKIKEVEREAKSWKELAEDLQNEVVKLKCQNN